MRMEHLPLNLPFYHSRILHRNNHYTLARSNGSSDRKFYRFFCLYPLLSPFLNYRSIISNIVSTPVAVKDVWLLIIAKASTSSKLNSFSKQRLKILPLPLFLLATLCKSFKISMPQFSEGLTTHLNSCINFVYHCLSWS